MTVQEARTVLSGPLRFGDPTQIEAVHVIEKLEELTEKFNNSPNCEECGGTGQETCPQCDGTGFIDCEECYGTGKDIEE